MNVYQISTLTKLFEEYNYVSYSTLLYKYSYYTPVKIPNRRVYALAAISNNESLYYNRDHLLDFSDDIDNLIEEHASIIEIIDVFEDIDYVEHYAKQYSIKNLTITDAQHIIDRCNAAIIRLNTYINEQYLVNQIENI